LIQPACPDIQNTYLKQNGIEVGRWGDFSLALCAPPVAFLALCVRDIIFPHLIQPTGLDIQNTYLKQYGNEIGEGGDFSLARCAPPVAFLVYVCAM
jgi:hypothetical protein